MKTLAEVEYIDLLHYKFFTDDGKEYKATVIDTEPPSNNSIISFPEENVKDYGVIIFSVERADSNNEPFDFFYKTEHDTNKIFETVWAEHGYEINEAFAKIKEFLRPITRYELHMSSIVAKSTGCGIAEATDALKQNCWDVDKAIGYVLKNLE